VTLLLSDSDVRQAVDLRELVDGIEAALAAEAAGNTALAPRMNVELAGSWLRVMPAILPATGVMGLKVFHGTPGYGVRYLILLYDSIDGAVVAVVDGHHLTAARTAATSAVASRYLAAQGPARLGVIGSGLEAESHCRALAAVTEISQVRVYSPNEARRRSFAERVQLELGIPASACDRAEDALDGADHVIVATNTGPSQGIACRAHWLSRGQHMTAIGSTHPGLRELETDVFRRADLVVFDADPSQLAEESGDVKAYCAEGASVGQVPTLSAVVGGRTPGRQRADQLTLYKSVGTALQDVVAADVIHRRAKLLGLGIHVPELCSEKRFFVADQVLAD
jgi:alanine dehydrogenase